MTKFRSDGIEATATWQVIVRRHGAIVHDEQLDTFAQAADVAAEWGDVEDVVLEVRDLRGRIEDDADAFVPEDEYPHA